MDKQLEVPSVYGERFKQKSTFSLEMAYLMWYASHPETKYEIIGITLIIKQCAISAIPAKSLWHFMHFGLIMTSSIHHMSQVHGLPYILIVSSPPEIRGGFSFLQFGQRGVMKKLFRNSWVS